MTVKIEDKKQKEIYEGYLEDLWSWYISKTFKQVPYIISEGAKCSI